MFKLDPFNNYNSDYDLDIGTGKIFSKGNYVGKIVIPVDKDALSQYKTLRDYAEDNFHKFVSNNNYSIEFNENLDLTDIDKTFVFDYVYQKYHPYKSTIGSVFGTIFNAIDALDIEKIPQMLGYDISAPDIENTKVLKGVIDYLDSVQDNAINMLDTKYKSSVIGRSLQAKIAEVGFDILDLFLSPFTNIENYRKRFEKDRAILFDKIKDANTSNQILQMSADIGGAIAGALGVGLIISGVGSLISSYGATASISVPSIAKGIGLVGASLRTVIPSILMSLGARRDFIAQHADVLPNHLLEKYSNNYTGQNFVNNLLMFQMGIGIGRIQSNILNNPNIVNNIWKKSLNIISKDYSANVLSSMVDMAVFNWTPVDPELGYSDMFINSLAVGGITTATAHTAFLLKLYSKTNIEAFSTFLNNRIKKDVIDITSISKIQEPTKPVPTKMLELPSTEIEAPLALPPPGVLPENSVIEINNEGRAIIKDSISSIIIPKSNNSINITSINNTLTPVPSIQNAINSISTFLDDEIRTLEYLKQKGLYGNYKKDIEGRLGIKFSNDEHMLYYIKTTGAHNVRPSVYLGNKILGKDVPVFSKYLSEGFELKSKEYFSPDNIAFLDNYLIKKYGMPYYNSALNPSDRIEIISQKLPKELLLTKAIFHISGYDVDDLNLLLGVNDLYSKTVRGKTSVDYKLIHDTAKQIMDNSDLFSVYYNIKFYNDFTTIKKIASSRKINTKIFKELISNADKPFQSVIKNILSNIEYYIQNSKSVTREYIDSAYIYEKYTGKRLIDSKIFENVSKSYIAPSEIKDTNKDKYERLSMLITDYIQKKRKSSKSRKEIIDTYYIRDKISRYIEDIDPEISSLYNSSRSKTIEGKFIDMINNMPIEYSEDASKIKQLKNIISTIPDYFCKE